MTILAVGAEAVHEERAVEVVQLVLPGARDQALRLHLDRLAGRERRADGHDLGAAHLGEDARDAQAAFLLEELSALGQDHRIDERLDLSRLRRSC